jgi:hypothetical protein
MGQFIRLDLMGKRFGRLTVRERARGRWICKCDCGELKLVRGGDLRVGKVTSCGCGRVKHGHARHVGERSPEYQAWENMKQRCYNPNTTRYDDWGGRGIRVCDRWLKFENFLADMGLRPSAGHSIDRIDNDGNYEPGNCRWATRSQQQRNRRDNVIG